MLKKYLWSPHNLTSPPQPENLVQHQTLSLPEMLHVVRSPVYPNKLFHKCMLNICTLLIASVFSTLSIPGSFYKNPFLWNSPAQCCTDRLQGEIHFHELQQPGRQRCCVRWPSCQWRSCVICSLGKHLRQVCFVPLRVK